MLTKNKGRHELMEDVDGSSLPADSQPKLVNLVSWSVVGSHLAMSLQSSNIHDPCRNVVSVLNIVL